MERIVECQCGQPLRLPEEALGKMARCPACAAEFRVQVPADDPAGGGTPGASPEPKKPGGTTLARIRAVLRRRRGMPEGTPPEEKKRGGTTLARIRARLRRRRDPNRPGRRRFRRGGDSGGVSPVLWVLVGVGFAVLLLGSGVAFYFLSGGARSDPPRPATEVADGSNDSGDDTRERRSTGSEKWEWDELYDTYSESVVVIGVKAKSEEGEVYESGGSGFIVHAGGLVVTNHHVVEEADTIEVKVLHKTASGHEEKVYTRCVPIYLDPIVDLAIVEVQEETAYPLRPVALHLDDSYREGQPVAAIGSPGAGSMGQMENTITLGTISSRERTQFFGAKYMQIDAAINPGNSGGPLFNNSAEVIGMSTFILRGKQQMNFAVPIRYIREALEKHGFGTWDEGKEMASCRAMLDAYFEAIGEEDLSSLENFLPTYLYTKDREEFNAGAWSYWEALKFRCAMAGISLEEFLETMKESGEAEASFFILSQMLADREENEEFTEEEIRNFYARAQLSKYEEMQVEESRINNLRLEGAVGLCNVTLTLRDDQGKERSRSQIMRCFKEREEWKILALPLNIE